MTRQTLETALHWLKHSLDAEKRFKEDLNTDVEFSAYRQRTERSIAAIQSAIQEIEAALQAEKNPLDSPPDSCYTTDSATGQQPAK